MHTCGWCGAPIERRGARGPFPSFCSIAHRRQYYYWAPREPARHTCLWCGAAIERHGSRGRFPQFCNASERERFHYWRRKPMRPSRQAILALAAAIVERARRDAVSPGADLDAWCHAPGCVNGGDHATRGDCHPAKTCARAWLAQLERLPRDADAVEIAMEVLAA
jgi:hypothetical protein